MKRRIGRWEQYYLERAPHCLYVSIPKDSRVIDRLIDKKIIAGFGFVVGQRAEHNLTTYGKRIARQLQDAYDRRVFGSD